MSTPEALFILGITNAFSGKRSKPPKKSRERAGIEPVTSSMSLKTQKEENIVFMTLPIVPQ